MLLPEMCPAVPRPELGHQPKHPPCHSLSWCHPRARLGKGTVSVTCNDQLAWLRWGPWQGSEALAVNRRCAARHKLPGGCPGLARCCLLGRERTALLTAATRHGCLAPLRWGIAASSRLGLWRVLEPGRQRWKDKETRPLLGTPGSRPPLISIAVFSMPGPARGKGAPLRGVPRHVAAPGQEH